MDGEDIQRDNIPSATDDTSAFADAMMQFNTVVDRMNGMFARREDKDDLVKAFLIMVNKARIGYLRAVTDREEERIRSLLEGEVDG